MENFLIYTNDYYITEKGERRRSPKKLLHMIKESCLSYGSSFEGRKEGFRYLCGNVYKNPVLLDDNGHKAFALTRSLTAKDCIAINLEKLTAFKNIGNEKTTLIFAEQKVIDIEINYRIIRRQVHLLKQYQQKRMEKGYNINIWTTA